MDCGLNGNGRDQGLGTRDQGVGVGCAGSCRFVPGYGTLRRDECGKVLHTRTLITIIVAMLATVGVAGAQTTTAATPAPMTAEVDTGAASADNADHATVDSLRTQVAQQQQRIHELEQAAADSSDKARTGSTAGMYDRAVMKILKMLPTSPMMWFWFVVGMGGEFIFFLRFVVQWLASERAKRTVVPMAFWHLSLIGTGMVLAYALYRIDPVFILAYGLNIFLYVRNLVIAKRQPAMATLMEKEAE